MWEARPRLSNTSSRTAPEVDPRQKREQVVRHQRDLVVGRKISHHNEKEQENDDGAIVPAKYRVAPRSAEDASNQQHEDRDHRERDVVGDPWKHRVEAVLIAPYLTQAIGITTFV